jgi:hypothetical protein
MEIFNVKNEYNIQMSLFFIITLVIINVGCSFVSTGNYGSNPDVIVSRLTTYQTSLTKSDVAKDFCNNLTEFFNTYKYYKIETEVYQKKDEQNYASSSSVTKTSHSRGVVYDVVYHGSAGWYSINFSNNEFAGSERIVTFRRQTVGGSEIRNKVYDTFTSWYNRVELAKKANGNDNLFNHEIDAAVEVERWFNSFIN